MPRLECDQSTYCRRSARPRGRSSSSSRLTSDLPAVPLVRLGAVAAAAGRLVLASVVRRFRTRFSERRRNNLEAAEQLLVGSRRKALAGLGLFALSPVPSAQLFVAAGC